MPTYEYRCPEGHEFERFYRKMGDAADQLPCPVCGKEASRRLTGGAGLVFKGSGFYLTDYGKNAHRGGGGSSSATSSGESSSGGEKSSSDSGSASSSSNESKSSSSESKGSDSKSGEAKSGTSSSTSSSGSKPDKS